MRRPTAAFGIALLLFGLLAPAASAAPAAPVAPAEPPSNALASGQLNVQLVLGGLVQPLGIVNAGDGTDRLFVIEKRGTVRVVQNRKLLPGFFLDIRNVAGGITTQGERGLLGLAFHPNFESNRKLFVYYTDNVGDLVIAEMTANASRTSASGVDRLLTIDHRADLTNHNGGQLVFGPEGYLYIFTGDGGGTGDPGENSQNREKLLGKVLRVLPDLNGGYTNPPGNPYLGAVHGADEIWAIGMRNPWRASFDRSTGWLWIADVGQGSWEEINRTPPNQPGHNYGWDCREGRHWYEPTGCSGLSFTDPIAEYGHGAGDCSVTGGYVYRGQIYLDMVGQYVLGDFCSGRMWTLAAGAGSPSLTLRRDTSLRITSFGEAESGELYLSDYANGRLYKVVAPEFSDVMSSSFIDEITWLGYEGITQGCGGGKYCPRSDVLREQMASFLVRALELAPSTTDYFDDDEASQHEADINALAQAGYTTGCTDVRFCPKSPVQRAHMATFLDRALDLDPTTQDFFTDDDGSIHEDAINRVAAAGITLGCGGTNFCPNAFVNREQMAAFLFRALSD